MITTHPFTVGKFLSLLWIQIRDYFGYWLVHISFLLPFICISLIIVIVLYLIRRIATIVGIFCQDQVFLEITPPAFTNKSSYTTTRLFYILHDLGRQLSFIDRLLGHKVLFSFEIVSTRSEGIRYLIKTTPDQADMVKRAVVSYLPQVRVRQINDYISVNADVALMSINEFKLKKHFAFPLAKQNVLEKHDPVAYITGMMTQLDPGELVSLQIVTSPTVREETAEIAHKILRNDDVLKHLNKHSVHWVLKVIAWTIDILLKIVQESVWYVMDVLFSSPRRQRYAYQASLMQGHDGLRPKRILSTFETEVVTAIQEKIDQPLFETSIRVLVHMNRKEKHKIRIQGLKSSLAVFSTPKYQSLAIKYVLPIVYIKKLQLFLFRKRILSPILNSSTSLLSASEIADLYHFPFTNTTKTEDLVKSKSINLPPPLSLKKLETKLDVTVGINTYGGIETQIGLTKVERSQHTYIVGKTGMGKSTIIEGMAYQDIQSGKGVCVIDPHGDMVDHLLGSIPENRQKDVVYINPSDKQFPIGLNILRPGTQFTDSDEEHDRIAESVIAIFMKITPEKHWGQRMEHILRNAVLTSLQIKNDSADTPYICLYTIQKLLTDETYRKKITGTLTDPVLKEFWEKQFNRFKKQQQADLVSPIANKIGEFITNKMSRNILLQKDSTLSLSDIMNNEKILLVNLSKGKIGEERSNFFGTVITSLIQLAVYERAYIKESDRKDFFVYIDEFQNFATSHFTTLFSEARKYHVYFTPTHQNIEQIKDESVSKIVTGNSGTIITLTCGPDDEQFLLPFFEPEVTKGQIVNLLPHHFFMKVTNGESEDAFSGETNKINFLDSDVLRKDMVSYSRKHYATPQHIVEKQLNKLFNTYSPETVQDISSKNTKTKIKKREKPKIESKVKREGIQTGKKDL